ncbi:MAG: hypothetical protein Tp138OMZ00d2C19078221_14 [Prokaryotic dsDNA virus sp.]|nr:hypothetical protein [Pseudomonadales bacterium]QDP67442.1 MAG: hypothetical protein Tp138OMZ00d2C19078221_14 [Prokaryotic dsDNA virus sp.]
MTLEERFQQIKNQLAESMQESAAEAMKSVHDDMMPFIEADSFVNARYVAERALDDLICGRFVRNGDYVSVTGSEGVSIRLKMTTHQYDGLRKSMLDVMPECPKDLEIRSLREQLEEIRRSTFGLGA